MRINRRFADWLYPELKMFSTDEQRAAAIRYACRKSSRVHLVPICLIVALGAATTFLLPTIGVPLASRGAVRGWIGLAEVVGLFTVMLPYCKHVRKNLRQLLNLDGPRVCVTCGYLLEESQSRMCPECGVEN